MDQEWQSGLVTSHMVTSRHDDRLIHPRYHFEGSGHVIIGHKSSHHGHENPLGPSFCHSWYGRSFSVRSLELRQFRFYLVIHYEINVKIWNLHHRSMLFRGISRIYFRILRLYSVPRTRSEFEKTWSWNLSFRKITIPLVLLNRIRRKWVAWRILIRRMSGIFFRFSVHACPGMRYEVGKTWFGQWS